MSEKTTFTDKCRKWFKGFGDTCSRFLLSKGISANAVTISGCVGHIFAAWLAATGHFTSAGILIILFAVTDFFDGTMARMSTNGTGTMFGAILDSTTDRYAEFLIFGGLVYYFARKGDMLNMSGAYLAIMGSVLVSYCRAKGEIIRINMHGGLMSRLERYIVLVVCLLFGWPVWCVWIIAVGANITAIQRLLHMKKETDKFQAAGIMIDTSSHDVSYYKPGSVVETTAVTGDHTAAGQKSEPAASSDNEEKPDEPVHPESESKSKEENKAENSNPMPSVPDEKLEEKTDKGNSSTPDIVENPAKSEIPNSTMNGNEPVKKDVNDQPVQPNSEGAPDHKDGNE